MMPGRNRDMPDSASILMPARRQRTISGKLNRLVIISTVTALLVGAVMSCWVEAQSFLQSRRELMLATANVFASAVSHAVSRADPEAVTQTLRAIARTPGFIFAEVRGQNGNRLADIGVGARLDSDLELKPDEDSSPLLLLRTRTLAVTLPVIEGGKSVGEIELVAGTAGLAEQFSKALLYALAGSGIALVIGLVLAIRLGRTITRPLRILTQAMLAVERKGHGTEPVHIISDDETGRLAERFNSMIAELRAATARILDREKEIIERLGKAGEMRDDQTGQHVVRVAQISRLIATELGLPPAYVDDLCRASPMHDVGKVSIPDAILHKPGRLDPDERREMEAHALRGFEILEGSSSDLVQFAAEIAISHHERWDGQGYPAKLAGTAIPLSGRITAVADVCDALLSERPYKKPWTPAEVRDFLLAESGAHFDPECVRCLLTRWEDLTRIYSVPTAISAWSMMDAA